MTKVDSNTSLQRIPSNFEVARFCNNIWEADKYRVDENGDAYYNDEKIFEKCRLIISVEGVATHFDYYFQHLYPLKSHKHKTHNTLCWSHYSQWLRCLNQHFY